MIEPVRSEVTVGVDPATAFAAFTDRIGEWWPLETHSIAKTGSVAFAGERLVETGPGGEEHEWGRVRVWEPPARLVFSWHLGRGEDQATEVEVSFAAVAEGTRLALEHRGWEAWGDEAAEHRASYDRGWPIVLGRYAEAT